MIDALGRAKPQRHTLPVSCSQPAMPQPNRPSPEPRLVVTARDPASGGGVAAAVDLLVQALGPERVTRVVLSERARGPRPRGLLDPWRVRLHHEPRGILWTNPSLRSRALVRDATTHTLWRGPSVTWVHGWDPEVERRLARHGPLHALLSAAWRNTRIMALTPGFAERIDALQLSPHPAWVLPPPFEPSAVAPAKPGSRTLLFLGRLSPEKDPLMALEVLTHLPSDVTLFIGGEGPLRTAAEARANALGVRGRVTFAGFVSGDRKRAAFAQAGALILPSTNEGLPLAALEATHAGLPVISAEVGALRETLNGINWVPATARTPEALAEAVRMAWKTPPEPTAARESVSPHQTAAVAERLWSWIRGWHG